MEELKDAIRNLTGALNAQIELNKKLERRIDQIENRTANQAHNNNNLVAPTTEQELKDIGRLPDCVKELRVFDGNPIEYVSWIYSVESILKDYDIVKDKPVYRAILQHIRQKIRGTADAALVSYNIFDENWHAIKGCLSLHYADKRDVRTLEYQLGSLIQGKKSVDEFYATVNHQLSLMINKIKTENYSEDTMTVLIDTYRNRALDVFIRGLNGDISKMLTIQRPTNLPEAYSSCLEIQNLNFRSMPIHNRNFSNTITVPVNQINASGFQQYTHKPAPLPRLSLQQKNMGYNMQYQQPYRQQQYQQQQYQQQPLQQHQNAYAAALPARPTQPKPPTPMSIDESGNTKRVNYMNRPKNMNVQPKRDRSPDTGLNQHKQQRVFHIEQEQQEGRSEYQEYIDNYSDMEEDEEAEENLEVNFTTNASPAFLT